MTDADLQLRLAEAVQDLGVPGAAAGVFHAGRRTVAFAGVTSIDNPLPVDEQTLFQLGSVAKTYTATALVRLVEQGRIDLRAPVRAYVPELRLQDERVADEVTVLHLLNHTAGWDGDHWVDTGEGDDALERYVEQLAEVPQLFPLGAAASYNNAAFGLAGRVIEKVTGQPYETALDQLVLAPLGLTRTITSLNDLMTRRCCVGHRQEEDGGLQANRPWSDPRAETAMGGRIAASLPDQRASSEHELMPDVRVGISWFLREIDGVGVVEHAGDVSGQQALLTLVPARDYAIAVLANATPNGQELKDRIMRWALEAHLGLIQRDPEPLDLSADELVEYTGTYRSEGVVMRVEPADARLVVTVTMSEADGTMGSSDTVPIGMLDGERFVVVDGPFKGFQGYFSRDGAEVVSLMLAGRIVPRLDDPVRTAR
jgi:CubicO group peptidase (beta-lactamase class C family)